MSRAHIHTHTHTHTRQAPESAHPLSFQCSPDGTLKHNGKDLLALEDMARGYKKPCVLDCKMGFSSVYPWAEPRYIEKFT
jgi:hypothetical protein